jgi:hypothetical protein
VTIMDRLSLWEPCQFATILAFVAVGAANQAHGADTIAVANGDWSSVATWSNGVPTPTNTAYIGDYPFSVATISLSHDVNAGTVVLSAAPIYAGTIDLSGHTLTVEALYFGYGPGGISTISRTGGGTLSVSASITLEHGFLGFAPGDVTSQLAVYNGASATTAASGNVTDGISIGQNSMLTLGADLSFTGGYLHLNGTLNANYHAVTAALVELGLTNSGPYAIVNRGPIHASTLRISSLFTPGQTTFSFLPADSVSSDLALYGISCSLPPSISLFNLSLHSNGAGTPTYASATTSTTANVGYNVTVDAGCTLSLGADLNSLGGVEADGTLNAAGHAITAREFNVGRAAGPGVFQNDGLVIAGNWAQGFGTTADLHHPGDTLGAVLLTQSSVLAIRDAAGQTSGLTLTGTAATSLAVDIGSDLILEVNSLAGGWVFRWANPSGGDHIADLQSLIAANEITFSYLDGGSYSLLADANYTYVNVIPIPEPTTLVLITGVGLLAGIRQIRRWVC